MTPAGPDVHRAVSGGCARLAVLLSPASRVEPELLRAVRLHCVPELDVAVEQELWFSTLVDARSDLGVTFDAEAAAVLRARLGEWYRGGERALVRSARARMAEVHALVSPLLRLEEELAWHDVTGDAAAVRAATDLLVQAVQARREGVDRWLARAWSTLPETVRSSPRGWALAQVAAAAGADPAGHRPDDARGVDPEDVAALLGTLPKVPLLLARSRGLLHLGVAEDAADARIQVPDTQPRLLEVSAGEGAGWRRPRRVLVPAEEPRSVEVDAGQVLLRTVAGDVYALTDEEADLRGRVRLGARGDWCAVRVGPAVVVGGVGPLEAALAALPQRAGVPVDLLLLGAPSAWAVRPSSPGPAPEAWNVVVGASDGGLPAHELGALVPGARLRSLAVDGDRIVLHDVVATPGAGPLHSLDARGARLVPGAPLLDDQGRVVGVVAADAAGTGPAPVGRSGPRPAPPVSAVPDEVVRDAVARLTDPRLQATAPHVLAVFAGDRIPAGSALPANRSTTELFRDGGTVWLARGEGRPVRGLTLAARLTDVRPKRAGLRRELAAQARAELPHRPADEVLQPLLDRPEPGLLLDTAIVAVRLDAAGAAALDALAEALLAPPAAESRRGVSGPAPAARQGDSVAGVCLHQVLQPSPGGPIPVPTPMPFNGTLADGLSQDVLVNGRPAAVLSSTAVNRPPHLPVPGIAFLTPPANRGAVTTGSATVLVNGRPMARAGDLVHTCADAVVPAMTPIVGGAPDVLVG